MFDRYIMYIFIGAKVNHTSSKYAVIHCPIFYQVTPLNLQGVQAPFLGNSPVYIVFFLRPPFQQTYIILEFSIFNPIPSFSSD